MERIEYFQLVQFGLINRLKLSDIDDLYGKHIRWYRYSKPVMSTREFTVGKVYSLLHDFENIDNKLLNNEQIEKLKEKSLTFRLYDIDNSPTPLITTFDTELKEFVFIDELNKKPVFIQIDNNYKGIVHRAEPTDIADLIVYIRRQLYLGNHILSYYHNTKTEEKLDWISPDKSINEIKKLLDFYGSLHFDGKIALSMLPSSFIKQIDLSDYDAIYQLSDGENNKTFITWIK